ncbi:MAG: PilN domain-containing protein [Cyanosarcina radialis HA8281-LM2]|jgi:type IV pilus assembly protein PilN|nr:PilN domain-containing protein [Cyanosarcina radialis HA8281-LM2]
MYGLDINFLKDRPEFVSKEVRGGSDPSPKTPMATLLPLYLGVAVGLFVPALVGGVWWFLQQENAKLTQQEQQLNAELGKLKSFDEQIQAIEAQTTQVQQDTQALAGVFEQVKPWSALLQDIRDRIPPGVQIESIQQTAAAPAPPPATPAPGASPAPAPPPAAAASKLEISGTATSFNNVNDFVLTLQRSPFFKPKETYLLSANLVDNKAPIETPKQGTQTNTTGQTNSSPQLTYKLPKVVQYKIQTTVTDVPSSQLILELESKGATGLTTRLRNLQNKGVIKP